MRVWIDAVLDSVEFWNNCIVWFGYEWGYMKTILHITECLGSGVLNYIKNLCEWQVNDFHIIIAYSTRPETPDDFERLF